MPFFYIIKDEDGNEAIPKSYTDYEQCELVASVVAGLCMPVCIDEYDENGENIEPVWASSGYLDD